MKTMKAFFALLIMVLFAATALAQSVSTAELHVTVKDPKGLIIKNASVTLTDTARGLERTISENTEGDYTFLQVTPGKYTVAVTAAGFAKTVANDVTLTIGQRAELPITLELATVSEVVNVTTGTALVETQVTSPTTTIDQQRIEDLPINGRNYINFTLTDSKLARDNTPNIPIAPTSGLNTGGQRARANAVNVDGADAVDNSTNGIRSTVSQEAVQEFQVITNSYNAEYGRASGGVVNIITKSGTNDVHGTAFGYLRNRHIQATNPFSNVNQPAYTRVQAGATLGGAIKKNKTFYFLSYETTRRHESGFSNIGREANPFGLVSFDTTALGQPFGTVQLTPEQATFLGAAAQQYASVLATVSGLPVGVGGGPTGPIATALKTQVGNSLAGYLTLAGGSSGIAVNRAMPSPAMLAVAANFPGTALPASCKNPANIGTTCPLSLMSIFPETGVPLPPGTSMFGLNSVKGNFPVTEGTTLVSARLDHRLNDAHAVMLRASVTPSTTTGLEVNGQGQPTGLNAASRTSVNQFRDFAITAQELWTIGTTKVNEFRFQFARRGLEYTYAKSAGGSAVADQIAGFAYLGREPFSFVRRTEQRYQFTDNFSISHGSHTIKFGGDVNYLPIKADFTVNFGGVYNFGGLPAGLFLPTPAAQAGCPTPSSSVFQICIPGVVTTPALDIPQFSAVQAYGLGFPQNFIQGVGNPHDQFSNKTLGVFLQDTWHMLPNLTLNYGVRYDIEFTPTFKPLTAMSAAAEKALGITEGIPVDNNNIAPRIGIAWDPSKTGSTVIRASYGLFYDHPLLGLAFDSDVADGSQAPQFGLLFGNPGCGSGGLATAVNAVNTFQGILATCAGASALSYLPGEQRFDPTPNAPSAFIGQQFINLGLPMTFLPDGFPVARNFQYAYANQANLAIEHQFGSSFALSVEYNFNGGRHLNRPVDSNPVVFPAQKANYLAALAAGDAGAATSPVLVGLLPPAGSPPGTSPSLCGVGPAGPYVAGPILNYFRKGGLNPSWVPFLNAVPGGAACLGLAGQLQAQYGLGVGVPIPFNAMGANFSNGSSVYHGMSVNLKKRMSNHYEFLASYTWSHAIDDSTDLETPLSVQDPFHPSRDRSTSIFDQRHRFVFSGIYQTGKLAGSGFVRTLFSDWTFAPIVEFASGRPFNYLTGEDSNLDGRSSNDRPSAVAASAGPNCIGELPVASPFSPTGYIQPGCFVDANFGNGTLSRNAGRKPWTVFNDLRVSRHIPITERVSLDGIMDVFNLPNRFNVADVNPLWNANAAPTSSFDPRQFQFALKLNW